MAEYGAAGGFASGLQGGIDAGSRLNALSLESRNSKLKSALALRGQIMDERKIKADAVSAEQAKAAKMADEITASIQTAFAEGDEAKMTAAQDAIAKLTTPIQLPNGTQGPSLADAWDSRAGRPPGFMSEKLRLIAQVTPGMADKAAGAGKVAGAETTARTNAELALAPQTTAAAAERATAVTGATQQAQVDVEAANRATIAANAAATAGAEAKAREAEATTQISKLQRDRQAAQARGDTRAAAEIDAQIQSLGASQTYDPRSASQLTGKEIRAAAQDVVRSVQAMTEVTNMQKLFEDTPYAAGALGSAFETLSGITGQLGALIGSDLSLPGDKDVTAARTQARLVVDQMLRAIGQSERASNQDRQRAEQISRALQPDASAQQVYSAAREALALMEREMGAAADQLLSGIDVMSTEGVEAAGAALGKNGVPRAQWPRIIKAVRDRRR